MKKLRKEERNVDVVIKHFIVRQRWKESEGLFSYSFPPSSTRWAGPRESKATSSITIQVVFLLPRPLHRRESTWTGDGHFLASIQSWWYFRPSLLTLGVGSTPFPFQPIYPLNLSYRAPSAHFPGKTSERMLPVLCVLPISSYLWFPFFDPSCTLLRIALYDG
jgi:hypothetical protein